MEDSNPFKVKENDQQLCFQEIVGLKKIESHRLSEKRYSVNSNPFQINKKNEQNLFVNPRFSNISQSYTNLFHGPYLNTNPRFSNKPTFMLPPEKALTRSQSKIDTLAYEHSIRKFKDVLREFYTINMEKNLYSSAAISFNKSKKTLNQNGKLFKATRLVFYKQAKTPKNKSFYKNENNYLIDLINNQIFIYQLNQPKLINIKASIIPAADEQISLSIEFDTKYNRIFYFSNETQEIVVMGIRYKQVICRVKVKNHRFNPVLFLFRYKEDLYLLIIGGYQRYGHQIEGSRYIQIFYISKWEITLNPIVLKTNIGRIKPIVFSQAGEEAGVYIVGGHSYSQIKKKKINLNVKSDINYSSNKTGIKISPELIEECFENKELAKNVFIVNNINVRFNHPLILYGGCVLYRKVSKHQKLQLFLPKIQLIYELKIINNQLYIIDSELYLLKPYQLAINRKINYHRDAQNQYCLCQINKDGNLELAQQKWKQKQNKNNWSSWSLGKIQIENKKQIKNNPCVLM